MTYDDRIGNEKGFEFACVKPRKAKAAMQEFFKPSYGVDILKVEFPVNMRYVEAIVPDHYLAFSREEAQQHLG